MLTGLGATAKHHVHEVNTVGVDDCERPGAAVRVGTFVCRVVSELKGVPRLPERTCREEGTIPYLDTLAHQSSAKSYTEQSKTHLDGVEGMEGVYTEETLLAQELNGDTVKATVKTALTTELTTTVRDSSSAR